jgi:hypothetical protein
MECSGREWGMTSPEAGISVGHSKTVNFINDGMEPS